MVKVALIGAAEVADESELSSSIWGSWHASSSVEAYLLFLKVFPSGHVLQEDDSSGAYCSSAQSVQDNDPSPAEYFPTSQPLHVRTEIHFLPASQLVHEAAPFVEYFPSSHVLHISCA